VVDRGQRRHRRPFEESVPRVCQNYLLTAM
jgi:hypothetical protein